MSREMTYTIKPLRWERMSAITSDGFQGHYADTPFGTYGVHHFDAEGWTWTYDVPETEIDPNIKGQSMKACKKAAEEHYLARLKSALTPVEATT